MGQVDGLVTQAQLKLKELNIDLQYVSYLIPALFGYWMVSFAWRFARVRMVSSNSLFPPRQALILQQVRGLPIVHSAIELFEAGHRSKLPHIPYITPVKALTLDDPWKKYEQYQTDFFACTQLTTPDYPVYVTASPTVAHSISGKGAIFLEPTQMFRYVAISIFGKQIVSTQTGTEHRRHKNVVKGCFGENIMVAAFDGMIEAMGTMFKELNLENGGVFEDTRAAMNKLTLLVFGSAAFGMDIPWNILKTDGKVLPFEEALHAVVGSLIAQLLIPVWVLEWFPLASVRYLGNAQRSLIHHFRAMVNGKRAELELAKAHLPAGEKLKAPSDILGAIVASQIDVEDEAKLKSGGIQAGLPFTEIIANMWIFVVAGHETSGHTLAWTLALLALSPEWQDAIYKEVAEVCGENWPTYRDVPQLTLTLAALYEGLRLRDLVMTIPKLVAEDTVVPYTKWDSSGTVTHHQHPVKAGSHVIIDSPACSRNPFVWSDPTTFNPRRWIDKTDKGIETFTGFSSGSRICIGKRMAEVEMVAVISILCKEFKMLPVPKEGESREEMEARMMKGSEELNLQPPKFGLKLEKRV